ncbi:hypothetical protein CYMTET_31791 [Cymbomonas tetramitiformis]|uniref:Uncharacterized protein n=1 Tax=Cymbomonas tetramitiformis TaxID=36881 RepID=A0AAE0FGR6_9CHLO|nr:hypothetical protein CYMTET_31791 [Cymbomonas tetramitiformis]
MYDVESPLKANNAAPNPDGSVYRHHQLMLHEWDIVRESMYLLRYAKEAVDLLQSTKTVTANLFLPVAGRLAYISHPTTPLKFENDRVVITNEDVKEAREFMYTACTSR